MKQKRGRKAFILLSDGVDYGSKASLGTAIEYAQRADTIIYSIFFAEPLHPYRPLRSAILGITREHGRNVMRRLAAETGGAFFEVTKDHSMTWIYWQIEEALRNQYSIGYAPGRPAAHGRYCRIKLTTKRAGLSVQAREGYYAK